MTDDPFIDPLARELADRVAAATPTTLAPFEVVARRAHRRRLLNGLAVAATVAVMAGTAVGAWSLRPSDESPSPLPPLDTPPASTDTSSPDATPAPLPSVDATVDPDHPSGITMELPGGDVEMPADISCWGKPRDCRRGLQIPGSALVDLGTHDHLEFGFAKPGWEFMATFRLTGEECTNAVTVDANATGDKTFRLDPAGTAGQYQVDLFGQGPEGMTSTKFVWTTTSDGPIDPPLGNVGLFPNSLGRGSFALEVGFYDLPFAPEEDEVSPFATVLVTGADGTVSTWRPPLIVQSMDCSDYDEGNFYYQGEWEEDFASLGGGPFELEVTVTIRGTTYVGSATWQRVSGESSMVPIRFAPPLPGAE